MSEWLVKLQDAVAGYPPWLVIGAGLVVAAGLCLLLAKVLRVVAVLILIAGVVAAGWFAWQAYGPNRQPTISRDSSVSALCVRADATMAPAQM